MKPIDYFAQYADRIIDPVSSVSYLRKKKGAIADAMGGRLRRAIDRRLGFRGYSNLDRHICHRCIA